jgi:hypothetical protein
MDSLSFATPIEQRPAPPDVADRQTKDVVLVANFGKPAAADYIAYAHGQGARAIVLGGDVERAMPPDCDPAGIVLFLRPRLNDRDRRAIDALAGMVAQQQVAFVGIVSTFRVHLGDRAAAEAETFVRERLVSQHTRTVVFRAGHLLSRQSRASRWLRRFSWCHPLLPTYLRSCFIEGDELFAAIESERRHGHSARSRVYTLLGPNRPWRAVLAQHQIGLFGNILLAAMCTLLAWLLIGHLVGLLMRWRGWTCNTLRPTSFAELLALYNKYNYGHLKIVGYNNGVVHFGQRYPGQTVVSTVRCNRLRWAGDDVLKADGGCTIAQARAFLARRGKELYVIPNYSYVCLGTSFFIPIHGSAADYSTVADTITRIVFYDPERDRIVAADRDNPAFGDLLYNLDAPVLLLRLYIRVKSKARYFVNQQELLNATAEQLLTALQDSRVANVEIRKGNATSDAVQIYRYYSEANNVNESVLEVPRDSLGRLWDRLEENRLTSWPFHALTRYLAWHVELFFGPEDFATFWECHRQLPLRKLQLRYIRRDDFPHSPFCRHDCVSVDMFMLRWHKDAFETYRKQYVPAAKSNPGKHSR